MVETFGDGDREGPGGLWSVVNSISPSGCWLLVCVYFVKEPEAVYLWWFTFLYTLYNIFIKKLMWQLQPYYTPISFHRYFFQSYKVDRSLFVPLHIPLGKLGGVSRGVSAVVPMRSGVMARSDCSSNSGYFRPVHRAFQNLSTGVTLPESE